MSARPTSESGSGLWPTVVNKPGGGSVMDGGSNSRKAAKKRNAWPTATAGDAERQSETMMRGNPTLRGAAVNWPTIHGTGNQDNPRPNGPTGCELGRAVTKDWQAPTSADGGSKSRGGKRKGELLLGGQVKAWPTPNTKDADGGSRKTENGKTQDQVVYAVKRIAGQQGPESHNTNGRPRGSLCSTWVETLMGFPLGWTDLT